MTSTSYNIGLMEGRNSSRVLRPPGGGHTDIFGAGEPEPVRKGRGRPQLKATGEFDFHFLYVFGGGEAEPVCKGKGRPQLKAMVPAEIPPPTNTPTNGSAEAEAPPKVAVIEEKEEKVVEKVIKEKPIEEPLPSPVKEEAKIEPPKRIRVPPGGFSSGLW